MNLSGEYLLVIVVVCAVGCGLMAGLLFAFSNFVMRAFLQQPPESGVRTMQAVNSLIQNPTFFALFFGTTIATLCIAVMAALHFSLNGSALLLLGSLLYLFGTFGVTVVFNVPLNNVLAGLAADSADAAQYWPTYVAQWLRWNHVRTVASVAAAALLTWAAGMVARYPGA